MKRCKEEKAKNRGISSASVGSDLGFSSASVGSDQGISSASGGVDQGISSASGGNDHFEDSHDDDRSGGGQGAGIQRYECNDFEVRAMTVCLLAS